MALNQVANAGPIRPGRVLARLAPEVHDPKLGMRPRQPVDPPAPGNDRKARPLQAAVHLALEHLELADHEFV